MMKEAERAKKEMLDFLKKNESTGTAKEDFCELKEKTEQAFFVSLSLDLRERSPPSRRRGLKQVIRTTVLVVVTSSLRRDNNYNSLQNNKYIDEKFYKHFMMAVLFDCFAFVY